MAQLVSHKEQLQKQREEHQAIIYNLERKAVLDNDRLEQELCYIFSDLDGVILQINVLKHCIMIALFVFDFTTIGQFTLW